MIKNHSIILACIYIYIHETEWKTYTICIQLVSGYDIPLKHILTIKNHIYLHISHDYNPTWIMFDPIRSKKESTEALLALEVLGTTSSSSTLGHLWAWL